MRFSKFEGRFQSTRPNKSNKPRHDRKVGWLKGKVMKWLGIDGLLQEVWKLHRDNENLTKLLALITQVGIDVSPHPKSPTTVIILTRLNPDHQIMVKDLEFGNFSELRKWWEATKQRYEVGTGIRFTPDLFVDTPPGMSRDIRRMLDNDQ